MERKFIKKARPFGEEERPPPPPPQPGQQNTPPEGQNSPLKTIMPMRSTTPPDPNAAPTPQPQPLSEDSGPRPRSPGGAGPAPTPPGPNGAPKPGAGPAGAPGAPKPGGTVPTDVNIDAATGAVTIKKGPNLNITFSQYQERLAAGEWPPEGYDSSWAPEEYGNYPGAVDPGRDNAGVDQFLPPQAETPAEELPPQGRYAPQESVKTRDPDTGVEEYGFIVQQNEDGTYKINYEDGSTRDLHEGWIMDAPEAADAGDPGNFDSQQTDQPQGYTDPGVYASLREQFFKVATHPKWVEFKQNDNEPQYGDWGEGSQHAKDMHDNPFGAHKNRLTPPLFDVKATVPEYLDPRSTAYNLQTGLNKDVEVSGNTLTIKDVEQPWNLITELSEYGIEARTTEDLTKFDQGIKDFKQGMKVAMIGDYPDGNYYYDPTRPAAQAHIITKTAENKYIIENDQFGRLEANEWELDYVRS